MIGRTSALAQLRGLIDSADVADGDLPAIALVSGEPGIGKTRLLSELLELVPRSMPQWTVTIDPGSMGRPSEPASEDRPDLTSVLARIPPDQPALLVVEDLHWIDAANAATLDRICGQPWPRLVVIGTYRPSELSRGAPGGELVLRLERRNAVEQVRLDRLDRIEIGAMIAAITGTTPSSELIEAMQRRSDGVPFVIEELLRVASSHGRPPGAEELASAQLPWSLDEAVHQQLGGLEPEERRVVDAIAIYGQGASFDAVKHIADLDDITLTHALQVLRDLHVVYETADERFWFTHALVASSVSRSMLGRERRRLHGRAFDAVRDADTLNYAALAEHAEGAGRDDEVPAIARTGAARYLEHGATFQALRLAAAGLAIVPNDVELLGIATNASWRLAFVEESLDLARRWERVAIEPLDRIESMRYVARLQAELDDPKAAREVTGRLAAYVGNLADPAVRGLGHVALAQLAMLVRDVDEAIGWADLAVADSAASGQDEIAIRAQVERASALISSVSRSEAEAAMNEALDGARRLGDVVLLSRALNNAMALFLPASARGRRLRGEAVAAQNSGGMDNFGACDAGILDAEAAFAEGDLGALRRVVIEGEQWWPMTDHRNFSLFVRLLLAAEEGTAEPPVDRAAALPADLRGFARERVVLAYLRAVRGDHAGARQQLDGTFAVPLEDLADTLDTVVMLVESAMIIGYDAAELDAELERWLTGHPSAELLRRHVQPLLRIAAGHPEEAVEPLADVLARPHEMLARPLAGSMRTTLAKARASVGDRAGAMADLQRAIDDELARWPGVRKDRAEAMRRRLEGSSSRPDGELTSREQEVAALLAEGLTNGQLAERLFISPKTAAVHVSNILAKLGLANRAEVAAWAVRHQLTPTG